MEAESELPLRLWESRDAPSMPLRNLRPNENNLVLQLQSCKPFNSLWLIWPLASKQRGCLLGLPQETKITGRNIQKKRQWLNSQHQKQLCGSQLKLFKCMVAMVTQKNT